MTSARAFWLPPPSSSSAMTVPSRVVTARKASKAVLSRPISTPDVAVTISSQRSAYEPSGNRQSVEASTPLTVSPIAIGEVSTQGSTTVKLAVPVRPSLAAVIVTGPAARPETSPTVDTDANVAFEVLHATERPVRTFPLASSSRATSRAVSPMTRRVTGDVTTTRETPGGPSVGEPQPPRLHSVPSSALYTSLIRGRARIRSRYERRVRLMGWGPRLEAGSADGA